MEQVKQTKTKEAASLSPLAESAQKLKAYGGFPFLASFVDGVQNLDPDKKARRDIFLKDDTKQNAREALKQKIELWIEVLSAPEVNGKTSLEVMKNTAENSLTESKETLHANLKSVLQATRELERNYRALYLFYKNAESEKVNVTILNAPLDKLQDTSSLFIGEVRKEFKRCYDRLNLRDNYSLMVLPGYLGKNTVVSEWAKVAQDHKVMLITDFANLDSSESVADVFKDAYLTGADLSRSNVIMTCNWLAGRGKVSLGGQEDELEEEDLFVQPSAALGGKIYSTLMSQVAAGKKFGALAAVDGVRFPLLKSELSELERAGLVPMIDEYKQVMAFSAKTLFNGDNIGLRTYSVVRVFDYITKVLFDFLNRRAFENWNSQTEADLRKQIVAFFDSIKGPDQFIENFKIMRFERDANVKDQINLDIRVTPYFPAKSFVIRLDGRKGDNVDNPTWSSDYGDA